MSRPWLRSRWVSIARDHIQKHLTKSRRFSSIPQIQGGTLSFRRSHSFADPDTPSTRTSAFPIDVIGHQTAVHEFSEALENGEVEKAREMLRDFLDQHHGDSSINIYRQLRAIITHSGNTNLPILLELGFSLAAKGYKDFVKDDIAPFVEEHATAEVFSKFLDILTTYEERKTKSRTTTAVFEEASEDYANVLSRFPLPPPSVMELMQEQLLPVLPDPARNVDSVFEEENDEYTMYAPLPTAEYSHNASAETLLYLVEQKQFDRAYALLHEMQKISTPIPPSGLYELAAIHVLRDRFLSPHDVAERFTRWFSLIPPMHAIRPSHRRDFAEIQYRILQSPTLNLELLQRCAMILASKGFANNRLKQFLPSIFAYLPHDKHIDFIHEIERRNMDYWLDHSPVKALKRSKFVSENIRGLAIRILTYGGHIDHALALIDKEGLTFPVVTYDILLKKLESSSKPEYRQHIPLLQSLRSKREERNKERENAIVDYVPPRRHIALEYTIDSLPSRPADPKNLPLMLRYLRKAILLEDRHRVLPVLLTNFMEDYLQTGRTFAISALLDKALRESHRATKLVLFSEMRYYRLTNQPDLVIKTFVDHFHLAGVPLEEVTAWYRKIQARRVDADDPPPPQRITGFYPPILFTNGKLWPDLEQCDLVWECLIVATHGDKEALMNLYNKFVLYAQTFKDSKDADLDPSSDPAAASISPLRAQTRFGLPVSGVTFHTFMDNMLPIFGPDFGHKILNDMWVIGLWPGKYHYGTLARYHAEKGHLQQVFAVIDKLEGGRVLEDRPPREGEGDLQDDVDIKQIPLFMQPDIPFYTNIMQGLIYSQNVEATEEVYRRLQKRCPCSPGSHPPLDRAMQKLADLKVLLNLPPTQHIPSSALPDDDVHDLAPA